MIEAIFSGLEGSYSSGVIDTETSFYFSIDDIKKTVVLTPEGCRVEDGKTIEEVDCVCKTGSGFFLKIWNDGYRPGMGDFMSGKIKSNNPLTLKDFLAAFGKE
jgi:putative sterol carrier protein